MKPRADRAAAIFAIGIFGFGLIGLYGSLTIQSVSLYDRFGPRLIPLLLSLLLILLGPILALRAIRGGWRDPEDEDQSGRLDFPDMAWVLAALPVQILGLLLGAGFVFSSLCLFLLAARGFGSRSPFRDVVAGLVLVLATYLLFTKGLALSLPEGPFEKGWMHG